MRLSKAIWIDGKKDSASIRKETNEARVKGRDLQEFGEKIVRDLDRLRAVRDGIHDASIDRDMAEEYESELDRMLAEGQDLAEDAVIAPMEENEARLLDLQEMAEDAASEHEAIAEGVDTTVEVTGFGIRDVVRDIDAEGDALCDAASEAAAALDLQIQQAEKLRREIRMRDIQRNCS